MFIKKCLIPIICLILSFFTFPSVKATGPSSTYPQTFAYQEENAPQTQSQYLYLFDMDNGQELLNRNGTEKMYPASMTKMMTAILAIENLPDLSQTITITSQMWTGLLEANASTAGFYPGSTPTVEDLLYGCLLPSGGDAVNALAYSVSGSIENFVSAMNEKASQLGMKDTHFANPTGLHDDNHYSTCHDIGILLAYCMQNETFRQILSAPSYTTSVGLTMNSSVWNGVYGLADAGIPGFEGGKTGFTNQAGRCLASCSTVNGMHLVLVTGKAEGNGAFQDASVIYNWYATHYSRKSLIQQGDVIHTCAVLDTLPARSFTAKAAAGIEMDLPSDAVIEVSDTLPVDGIPSPIETGEVLGTFAIHANAQIVYQDEIKADQSYSHNYAASFLRHYRLLWTTKPAAAITWHVLLISIILMMHVLKKRSA